MFALASVSETKLESYVSTKHFRWRWGSI